MSATTSRATSIRQQELRQRLEAQREHIRAVIRQTIRVSRDEGALEHDEVRDEAERTEADVQSDLEFALLEIHGEMLEKITAAIERLDDGHYGACIECGGEISARRLQALPFATRCVACEDRREGNVLAPLPGATAHRESSRTAAAPQ